MDEIETRPPKGTAVYWVENHWLEFKKVLFAQDTLPATNGKNEQKWREDQKFEDKSIEVKKYL
jgi:hypothetical protein